MNYVYFGKIVNTHGIKGEIRILSDFEKKEIVLNAGFTIYIGKEKRKEKIESYRHHKSFEMIRYQGITNINEVLEDIGKNVYIKREDLNLAKEEYLLEDILNFSVLENSKTVGKVKDFVYNKTGILLLVEMSSGEKFYIPNVPDFIRKIDLEKKCIIVNNIQGLIL